MGRRCAFSARKRSDARRPADVLPSVKPHSEERKVVSRRRRSKGMPRRGALVGVGIDFGGGGGLGSAEESEVVAWRAAMVGDIVTGEVKDVLVLRG